MSDKPRAEYGRLAKQIQDLLAQHPAGLTGAAVSYLLDHDPDIVRKLMNKMTAATPRIPQRLRVKKYVWAEPGQRDYPRPVYVLGPGKNAKRPGPQPRGEIVRRWYAKKNKQLTSNFVFNLGTSARDRIKGENRCASA